MMTMILDGYNVIHAVPELARHLDRSLQSAREALVRLCQEYRRGRGDVGRCYVVFDGRADHAFSSPASDLGCVAVLFTQEPEEADARILRLIEAERGRGRCVVVSNDNEVSNNARAFGARIISAQEFYKSIRPAAAPGSRASTGSGKAPLSPRDAQQITEGYRKHLERNKR